ncbi:hypothetical protein PR202_ga06672 [Eleusine coracana subsp. coracana]|uniref:ClpA/ClpB AAA lid domain-containing protein n=1 Tax=Eleusine coracana subsp. coracana TaxID=191504 RepID=A0AAV5BXL1_ELECO|nr:hypothetical protein PR202_ga06672 [Eleusine coracana subsp. coracana]
MISVCVQKLGSESPHPLLPACADQAAGARNPGDYRDLFTKANSVHWCKCATTFDEYRKYTEKDAALERRFQQVYCGEPAVEDTVSIMCGLRERYELHHGAKISDGALVAAAVLSALVIFVYSH